MVIDRIIAGTIFVLGIVQIALMYAAPDMAPLSMTAPTLVLVAIMVAAYIIEATTIFFVARDRFHAVDMHHCRGCDNGHRHHAGAP